MALRQWFIYFFDKKSGLLVDKYASCSGIKNVNISIRELAEELYKPITRKFKKSKVHSSFIDNIWGVDLADMQLIRKFKKEFVFYYVLLIFLVNMHGLLL